MNETPAFFFMKKQIDKSQIIYGTRAIMEALQKGKELEKILIQKAHQSLQVNEIIKLAYEYKVPYQFVPKEKFWSLGDSTHQGVLAYISPIIYQPVEEILTSVYERGEVPCIVVLDRVTDVRNFGAICRSALAAGVHAVVIPDRGSARINEDAVKTSAGALLTIPVCRSFNLKETLEYLKNSGLQILACTEKGERFIDAPDYTIPTAIMMGSEEDGISPEYLKFADEQVKIPMLNQMGSLNVSVACGIILYELVKQRMKA